MRRLSFIGLTGLLLLSACSTGEQEANMNNENPNETQSTNQEATTENTQETSTEDNQSEESSSQAALSDEETEMIANLPADASVDDWNLILVNGETPIPEDYEVNLADIGGEQVDERIVSNWYNWQEAAANNGFNIFVASGYRDTDLQETNYNNTLQSYINEGHSEEEAKRLTEEYLTQPGHSEHHTGLAIDLLDSEWAAAGRGLETEFETQDSQQWLVETMADFGFILRYPEGKEEITGIQYEPWHFRFVGEENAQFMNEYDLVLEEYSALLEQREQIEGETNS